MVQVVFPSARSDGQPLLVAWHAACAVTASAPAKLTLQFFKEFPEGGLPPLVCTKSVCGRMTNPTAAQSTTLSPRAPATTLLS